MYNTPSYKIARGLGWFSIALGAVELLAPRFVSRSFGMAESDAIVRSFGVREVLAGLGILAFRNPTPWVWSRVAGDAVDMAALALALDGRNPRRGSAMAALVAVAGVTVVDILTARSLGQVVEQRQQPRRDYSDRRGIGSGGATANMQAGSTFRTVRHTAKPLNGAG